MLANLWWTCWQQISFTGSGLVLLIRVVSPEEVITNAAVADGGLHNVMLSGKPVNQLFLPGVANPLS